jgi:transposase
VSAMKVAICDDEPKDIEAIRETFRLTRFPTKSWNSLRRSLSSEGITAASISTCCCDLGAERKRLLTDESAQPKKELAKHFTISKAKYARKRTIDYNIESIKGHRNAYAGHICFITNDKTIGTAADALGEYSTREYMEKDFDEMKNDLDMKRIRVHTDVRMKARLFVQFVAEIYMREIRAWLRRSDDCKKLTWRQTFNHIKGIYKVKFRGKYKDVFPALSRTQRCILDALRIAPPG